MSVRLKTSSPAAAEGISRGGLCRSTERKVLPHDDLVSFLQTVGHFGINPVTNAGPYLDRGGFLFSVGPGDQLIHCMGAAFTSRTVSTSTGPTGAITAALAPRCASPAPLARIGGLGHGVACRGGPGCGINRRGIRRSEPEGSVGDSQGMVSLGGDDGNIGGHAGPEFEVGIIHGNDGVI